MVRIAQATGCGAAFAVRPAGGHQHCAGAAVFPARGVCQFHAHQLRLSDRREDRSGSDDAVPAGEGSVATERGWAVMSALRQKTGWRSRIALLHRDVMTAWELFKANRYDEAIALFTAELA